MKLLSTANTKLKKGEAFGYTTYGLSLAPHKLSGKNLCAYASEGCALACLNTSGMGRFSNVQAARITKAKFFVAQQTLFMSMLVKELENIVKKNTHQKNAVRLNVVSDVAWEKIEVKRANKTHANIMEAFPEITYYDYTKNPYRAMASVESGFPSNYVLTFSRSESNQKHVTLISETNVNIAVVFSGLLPATYLGRKVVNGDESDLRFLDDKSVIVGLKAKGNGRKDVSGFVVH